MNGACCGERYVVVPVWFRVIFVEGFLPRGCSVDFDFLRFLCLTSSGTSPKDADG